MLTLVHRQTPAPQILQDTLRDKLFSVQKTKMHNGELLNKYMHKSNWALVHINKSIIETETEQTRTISHLLTPNSELC